MSCFCTSYNYRSLKREKEVLKSKQSFCFKEKNQQDGPQKKTLIHFKVHFSVDHREILGISCGFMFSDTLCYGGVF